MDTLKLSGGAWVEVELPEGDTKAKFDLYALLEEIIQGESDHGVGTNESMYPLRQMMATKLDVEVDAIAINQVLDLREAVCRKTTELDEERKKKFSSTANSPVSTQEFPLVSPSGQSESKTPGSQTVAPSPGGG